MKLNQITLPSNDLDATKAFYTALGCHLIVDTPHYLRFKAANNNTSFSFVLDENINTSVTVYFECDNLAKTVNELIEKGIIFQQMPSQMRYLWQEAILLDPSGNKIKLYFAGENRLNPPWRV